MSSDTFQPHTYPEAKHEIRSRRRFKRTKHCSTSRYKLKKKNACYNTFLSKHNDIVNWLCFYDNTKSRAVLIRHSYITIVLPPSPPLAFKILNFITSNYLNNTYSHLKIFGTLTFLFTKWVYCRFPKKNKQNLAWTARSLFTFLPPNAVHLLSYPKYECPLFIFLTYITIVKKVKFCCFKHAWIVRHVSNLLRIPEPWIPTPPPKK